MPSARKLWLLMFAKDAYNTFREAVIESGMSCGQLCYFERSYRNNLLHIDISYIPFTIDAVVGGSVDQRNIKTMEKIENNGLFECWGYSPEAEKYLEALGEVMVTAFRDHGEMMDWSHC